MGEPHYRADTGSGSPWAGDPHAGYEYPTDRSDVIFARSVQSIGLAVSKGDMTTRLGVFSDAPKDSPAAVASAMVQISFAGAIATASIAVSGAELGAPGWAVLATAAGVFCLFISVAGYLAIRENR